MEVVALRLDEGYYLAQQIIDMFFLATTSGEYLDRRAADEGVVRNPGSKAAGFATASRSTPAPFGQLIPRGTIFETEDGLVQFVAKDDVTLAQGETSVSFAIEAVNVGSAGNLQTGTILRQVGVAISLIETVSVDSPGLSGGLDKESDESLRARILELARKDEGSGNKSNYEIWAKEVSGVGYVLVEPLWQGPGTVRVVILDQDGNVPTPNLVAAVQDYLDPGGQGLGLGKAPIGAKVTVEAPVELGLTITLPSLVAEVGYTVEQAKSNLETAAKSYILSVSPGGVVRIKEIEAVIASAPGVLDFGDILVNGARQNIELAVDQKASLAGVVFV